MAEAQATGLGMIEAKSRTRKLGPGVAILSSNL